MTDEELGANIRRVRDMKGKSQLDLAIAIQSSQKHISRIEKGQASATFTMIGKICQALKVDLKTLLNFDERTVFNNVINNENGEVKEFVAYNNTDVERVEKLYEKLLAEKDAVIEMLKKQMC
jgi:transcriptional regulator with XRE-family HTH domain